MSTTVIFSNFGDDDCENLRAIWDGIPNVKVVEIAVSIALKTNVDELVVNAIENEYDTLILAGHGSYLGLYSPTDGYLFDKYFLPYVHAKKLIFLWSYSYEFCIKNEVSAFCSSMFISNPGEALVMLGEWINDTTISRQNIVMYNEINKALKENLDFDRLYYNLKQLKDKSLFEVPKYKLVNNFNIDSICIL